jgi:hypothetical protein
MSAVAALKHYTAALPSDNSAVAALKHYTAALPSDNSAVAALKHYIVALPCENCNNNNKHAYAVQQNVLHMYVRILLVLTDCGIVAQSN